MHKIGSARYKTITFIVLFAFIGSILIADLFKIKQTQASALGLPEPTQLLTISDSYSYPLLKGLKIDPKNPLQIEFIIDTANRGDISTQETETLVSYFLAGLTMPQESLWVNLSPYEKDRVVDQKLGQTDMGKDLLGQDYILKQLSSSLTHPDTPLGKAYWSIENRKSKSEMQNAFNKIWITPESAEVEEENNLVLISKSSLDVKTEKDYLASSINGDAGKKTDLARNLIIPKIKEDVNNGKNFAKLRQIYSALILSSWFKQKFKNSFYKQYIDQSKVSGIDLEDKTINDKIYKLYCQAFKKGVYNFIRNDKTTKQKRAYFSGGMEVAVKAKTTGRINKSGSAITTIGPAKHIKARLDKISSSLEVYLPEKYKEKKMSATRLAQYERAYRLYCDKFSINVNDPVFRDNIAAAAYHSQSTPSAYINKVLNVFMQNFHPNSKPNELQEKVIKQLLVATCYVSKNFSIDSLKNTIKILKRGFGAWIGNEAKSRQAMIASYQVAMGKSDEALEGAIKILKDTFKFKKNTKLSNQAMIAAYNVAKRDSELSLEKSIVVFKDNFIWENNPELTQQAMIAVYNVAMMKSEESLKKSIENLKNDFHWGNDLELTKQAMIAVYAVAMQKADESLRKSIGILKESFNWDKDQELTKQAMIAVYQVAMEEADESLKSSIELLRENFTWDNDSELAKQAMVAAYKVAKEKSDESLKRTFEVLKKSFTWENNSGLSKQAMIAAYVVAMKQNDESLSNTIEILKENFSWENDPELSKQAMVAVYEVARGENEESLRNVIETLKDNFSWENNSELTKQAMISAYNVAMTGSEESLKICVEIFSKNFNWKNNPGLTKQAMIAVYEVAMKKNEESLRSVIDILKNNFNWEKDLELTKQAMIAAYIVSMRKSNVSLQIAVDILNENFSWKNDNELVKQAMIASYEVAMNKSDKIFRNSIKILNEKFNWENDKELSKQAMIASYEVTLNKSQKTIRKMINVLKKNFDWDNDPELAKQVMITAYSVSNSGREDIFNDFILGLDKKLNIGTDSVKILKGFNDIFWGQVIKKAKEKNVVSSALEDDLGNLTEGDLDSIALRADVFDNGLEIGPVIDEFVKNNSEEENIFLLQANFESFFYSHNPHEDLLTMIAYETAKGLRLNQNQTEEFVAPYKVSSALTDDEKNKLAKRYPKLWEIYSEIDPVFESLQKQVKEIAIYSKGYESIKKEFFAWIEQIKITLRNDDEMPAVAQLITMSLTRLKFKIKSLEVSLKGQIEKQQRTHFRSPLENQLRELGIDNSKSLPSKKALKKDASVSQTPAQLKISLVAEYIEQLQEKFSINSKQKTLIFNYFYGSFDGAPEMSPEASLWKAMLELTQSPNSSVSKGIDRIVDFAKEYRQELNKKLSSSSLVQISNLDSQISTEHSEVGGIDMQAIAIQTDTSSALFELDMSFFDDFKGFTFNILSSENIKKEALLKMI